MHTTTKFLENMYKVLTKEEDEDPLTFLFYLSIKLELLLDTMMMLNTFSATQTSFFLISKNIFTNFCIDKLCCILASFEKVSYKSFPLFLDPNALSKRIFKRVL